MPYCRLAVSWLTDSTASVRIVGLDSHVGLDDELRSTIPLDCVTPLAISTTTLDSNPGLRVPSAMSVRNSVEAYKPIFGQFSQDPEMVPTLDWNDVKPRSESILSLDLDSQAVDHNILPFPILLNSIREYAIPPPTRMPYDSPNLTHDRSAFLPYGNRPLTSQPFPHQVVQGMLEGCAAAVERQSAVTLIIPSISSSDHKPNRQNIERLIVGTGSSLDVDRENEEDNEEHHDSSKQNQT